MSERPRSGSHRYRVWPAPPGGAEDRARHSRTSKTGPPPALGIGAIADRAPRANIAGATNVAAPATLRNSLRIQSMSTDPKEIGALAEACHCERNHETTDDPYDARRRTRSSCWPATLAGA